MRLAPPFTGVDEVNRSTHSHSNGGLKAAIGVGCEYVTSSVNTHVNVGASLM